MMTSVALAQRTFDPARLITCAKRGLVVKWLSRLPVTEEIAGSSPVGPAKQNASAQLGLFVWARFQLLLLTVAVKTIDKKLKE
jgi:hypothetical protein